MNEQETRIEKPQSQNATKHGGEAAIKRLADGQPFTGLAAAKQAEVRERLETEGIDAIMEDNAIDVQAVRDLFRDALAKAIDDGNEKQINGYADRFQWFADKAMKHWAMVRANRKQGKPALMGVLQDYDNERGK
jgi:hypothetical protein